MMLFYVVVLGIAIAGLVLAIKNYKDGKNDGRK